MKKTYMDVLGEVIFIYIGGNVGCYDALDSMCFWVTFEWFVCYIIIIVVIMIMTLVVVRGRITRNNL